MNPPAPGSGEDEPLQCFFCGGGIVPGQWFARFNHGNQRVVFCRARCVELFLERSPVALPEWSLARAAEV